MFEAVSNKIEFPRLEEEVLRLWEQEDTFRRSVNQRRGQSEYVFYDGPPFATGLPHYGHLLAGTIKDIIPRYQAMRGHYVERRFGWDCHGLPIEALAQEALGLAGPQAIRDRGVGVFNEQCRAMVLKYVAEWRQTVTRLGRWVDFDNDYKTMDVGFMESVWWVFKQLWDQGRIYRAHRIMPYSWKLTTPLSNFEAGSNYKDIQDPAITVRFRLRAPLAGHAEACALAWTTTPWTLPGNLALCVHPELEYVLARLTAEDTPCLLAAARLDAVRGKAPEPEVLARFTGRDLAGLTYEPLFPELTYPDRAHQILCDGFVGADDGTGIVHLAPAYGEDDYRVCRAAELPLVDWLDEECRFTDALPDYAGQFCKEADKAICKRLNQAGLLFRQDVVQHSYPFCERTDTPLIYRAIEAWYVRVEDLRDRLTTNNDGIHWVPAYVGDKRFGNWLKDAKDWNISRNRFWGSCIPVWVAEDGSDALCVGSRAELEALSGVQLDDLHKHFVDEVVIRRNGKVYRRTPEVLDCWFESGAMPYAQTHYPFEGADTFAQRFPADFIAEGLDQTRGWFYTLMVLSTALFDQPAFRNVVVNGLVLAADGRKMSKRLKNYPDPNHILDEYGADALRLYLLHSPVVRAEDLCFTEAGVKHALRHLLLPWWNAYAFFVTYARIDGWQPAATPTPVPQRSLLDRWILSCLARLNQEVVAALDAYDLQRAVRPFVRFIEDLTNWYIRRSRRRFWKSSDDADKTQAYETLYTVLLRLSQIAAPFVPFISDAIYRNLRPADAPDSVHLCDFPLSDDSLREFELEAQMEAVLAVVSLGRQLRTEHTLKVRQPLRALHVVVHSPERVAQIEALAFLIADELNVKEVRVSRHEARLAELHAKADFRQLGPRLGPRMKIAAGLIQELPAEVLAGLIEGGSHRLDLGGGHTIELTLADLVIERRPYPGLAVAAEGEWVVALDTQLDPELEAEGLAREFVNKAQSMRKAAELEVTDRIRLAFATDADATAALLTHRDTICAETLAVALDPALPAGETGETLDLNGHPCTLRLQRA